MRCDGSRRRSGRLLSGRRRPGVSLNVKRRNLTKGQLAISAAAVVTVQDCTPRKAAEVVSSTGQTLSGSWVQMYPMRLWPASWPR